MPRTNEIQSLFSNPEDSYVLHYSYLDVDSSDGVFKKVISIHAKNLDSSDSREFAIDKYVLKNDISIEDIDDWLDDVELAVLDEFNSFLREKSNCKFIYFDDTNGQGLILNELERIFESRNSSESNKKFKQIPRSNRKSLFYLFQFDSQNKSLKDFIKLFNNNNLPLAFLTNAEEGSCFEKRHFNKLRASILCKIDFIIALLNSHNAEPNKNKVEDVNTVDLENLKPSQVLKNMNIKSWGILIGILIAVFSLGAWVNSLTSTNNDNNLKDKNQKLLDSIKTNKSIFEKREAYLIDSLNSNFENLKEVYTTKIDSLNKIKLKQPK